MENSTARKARLEREAEQPCRCIAAGEGGTHWPSDHKQLAPTTDRVRLTDEEWEKVESTIRWHMACDAGTGQYVGLCVANARARVESILTAREAALREQIAADIEALRTPEDASEEVKASSYPMDAAYHIAARIARGDS